MILCLNLKKIALKLVVGLPSIFLLLWMVTTTVSENFYGDCKKRWCSVLFNFGRLLKDEPSIEDDDTDESEFLIIDEDAIN